MPIKQFVPSEHCLKCDVCCRFLDIETPLVPVLEVSDTLTALVSDTSLDRYICRNFNPAKNNCKDYQNRPLDCQIYPFIVMWSEDYRDVVLAVDPKCPYVEKIPNSKIQNPNKFQISNSKFQEYKNYLFCALKNIDPKYIIRFQDDVIVLGKLEPTPPKEPALNKLLIGDRPLFEKYARYVKEPLSNYSFISNYVWTGLLDYSWAIIDGSFCLFCLSAGSFFMPIPPMGPRPDKSVISRCFDLMDRRNKNKNCSRIEDVREGDSGFFKDMGCAVKEKGQEYIYRQKDLVNLAGDKYKDKRALCNYFEKNYKFEYRNFTPKDTEACLTLFKVWQKERVQRPETGDRRPVTGDQKEYYKALMEDSFLAHKKAILRYNELGLWGRIVLVDDKISAYTFGYPLNDDTFVVLFEISDLNIKGAAQFIFRELCRELDKFELVNTMDDSDLENLKETKMSYHPVKIERIYCAYRK